MLLKPLIMLVLLGGILVAAALVGRKEEEERRREAERLAAMELLKDVDWTAMVETLSNVFRQVALTVAQLAASFQRIGLHLQLGQAEDDLRRAGQRAISAARRKRRLLDELDRLDRITEQA